MFTGERADRRADGQAGWQAGNELNAKACFLIIIKAKIKYVTYTQRKQKRERKSRPALVKVETFIQRQLAGPCA